jgi:ribosomal protein S15P/S13E
MPKKAEEKKEEKAEEEKQEEKAKKAKKKTAEEFEKRVVELAESGLTAEKIGETLRKEGIHSKEYGKKISKILGHRYVQPDEKNLQKKLESIEKHVDKNKSDKRAMREKQRISATLRRLRKYLKK